METKSMVIDSGIFIEYLRAKNKKKTILHNIPNDSEIFISSVTLYELYAGATNERKWDDVTKLTEDLPVLSFTESTAQEAAKIFQKLKKRNQLIEFRDIFIGATAKIYQLPVKTINKKDYTRIEGLKILD